MIRENRKKNNLTQEELAEKVGISWRQLQRLEIDEENTTVKTLKKIVRALSISDDEILEYLKKQDILYVFINTFCITFIKINKKEL